MNKSIKRQVQEALPVYMAFTSDKMTVRSRSESVDPAYKLMYTSLHVEFAFCIRQMIMIIKYSIRDKVIRYFQEELST